MSESARKVLINKRVLAFIAALLLINGGLALFIIQRTPADTTENSAKYPLLEKALGQNNEDIIINFGPLRDKIEQYFAGNVSTEHSFYLEYLPTGTSIRIENDNKGLIGASLLKLPITMDLYKARELGRVNLDKQITIQPEWLDADFGELYKKGAGTKLTLRQAVKETLHNSDNTALNAIYATTDKTISLDESVVNEIDAPFIVTPEQHVQITAKSYSSILKCLYYGCFNSKADSQEILRYLTETPDSGRLEAGIPRSVTVAHKIGTFSTLTQSDCGIVYVPGRHYVICMMVNQTSTGADKLIKDVSAMTYDYIANTK